MIAELGQLCLAMAFSLSVITGISTLWWVSTKPMDAESYHWFGRSMAAVALLVASLVGLAFMALLLSFVGNDFSVKNVAQNSNSLLPIAFRLAASWGSHEGSMLLWVLMLSVWSAAVAVFSSHLSDRYRVRVLAVLACVNAAFLLFLITASNPFERLLPAPSDGRDLNPLLQDWVMIIHPPMLYMGYVGFAVTFAFAVAALLEGRLDAVWARWSRPWANAAWSFLTMGILLGSWWAYRELGWGGWWFWDPVENASLMPWLAGTALIHSLAVTDKRDTLKSWTILLALTAFALSLLGTFLVRSGVLTSVHAFATDPKRGIFILALLLLVIGGSYVLYAFRTREVGIGTSFQASSREALLLSNNVLMSATLAAVMLGTLYPLLVEVLAGRKMSVGQPYFEAVFAPLLLPAVALMAAGPASRWKAMKWQDWIKSIVLPLLIAGLVVIALIGWSGKSGIWFFMGMTCAMGLALATIEHAVRRVQQSKAQFPQSGLGFRAQRLGVSYWAMIIAHVGVAVFVAGVTLVKTFEVDKDILMQPGDTEILSGWRVTFIGVDDIKGPNYVAAHGVFELTTGAGKVIYLMEPEKRRYLASGQVMTEAAIDSTLMRDVYIALGEPAAETNHSKPDAQAWSVRIYIKPFINWIWLGCLMMAFGGAITLLDRRYRTLRGLPARSSSVEGAM